MTFRLFVALLIIIFFFSVWFEIVDRLIFEIWRVFADYAQRLSSNKQLKNRNKDRLLLIFDVAWLSIVIAILISLIIVSWILIWIIINRKIIKVKSIKIIERRIVVTIVTLSRIWLIDLTTIKTTIINTIVSIIFACINFLSNFLSILHYVQKVNKRNDFAKRWYISF